MASPSPTPWRSGLRSYLYRWPIHPPLNLTPQRQKQQTLEAIVALLLALAAEQPVLFIIEDVHWIDPSTLEFLTLLIDQVPGPSAHPADLPPRVLRALGLPCPPYPADADAPSAPSGPDECAGGGRQSPARR